MNGLLWHC